MSNEILVKTILHIIEKTSEGGATKESIERIYEEISGIVPAEYYVRRQIGKINKLFNPNNYANVEETVKKEGNHYLWKGELSGTERLNAEQSFAFALRLYSSAPQSSSKLDILMKLALDDAIRQISNWNKFTEQIEKYVYFSGYTLENPKMNVNVIKKILRAIDKNKRVSFSYRNKNNNLYDIEPYGLICRHERWYLVGKPLEVSLHRIFRLDVVENLSILENSVARIPESFKLAECYGSKWGVWSDEDEMQPETIIIRVDAKVAKKFQGTKYHSSQKVITMKNGDLEVHFTVSGASEMISWVLGWGGSLRIQEPRWLRDEYKSLLSAMLNSIEA